MTILLRHDVDNAFNVHLLNYLHFKFPHLFCLPSYLENETLMVKLEKQFGLKATYFFRARYTPPSYQLLRELDEDSFEVGIHIDGAWDMGRREALERLWKRRIYGCSTHGSSFGILAPDSDKHLKSVKWTKDRIRKTGFEYVDGAGRLSEGEIVTVDKSLRLNVPLKSLLDLILKNADGGLLKLIIHPTYMRGYGLFGGYGLYPPIIEGVRSIFGFLHDSGIKTYTYHEYVGMASE
jgi:hypothetical protein